MLFTTRGLVRAQLLKFFHRTTLVDAHLVDEVYRPFFARGFISSVVNAYRNADFGSVETSLGDITAPALLIWGREDPVHGQNLMTQMVSMIPDSRLVVFEDSGHMPHEEEAERFSRLSLEFLRESAGRREGSDPLLV